MASARRFLSQMIDYAGLFPPARLSMLATVTNYDAYRRGEDRGLLGRLIVPADRLEEFGSVAKSFLSRETNADPWRLSVIASGDLAATRQALLEFNCGHWRGSANGHASVDSVEIAVRDQAELDAAAVAFPGFVEMFLEIPVEPDPESLVESIANVGVRAKIRTGGISPEKFPDAPVVARFIATCRRHGVKFKATAGLHHPVKGLYPMTYEIGSQVSAMFGFLNLLVAAGFIHGGLDEAVATGVLEENDARALRFDDDGVEWKGHRADAASLHAARHNLALSFGSCSFDEPVVEARLLGFL